MDCTCFWATSEVACILWAIAGVLMLGSILDGVIRIIADILDY
jgi:hypothetical protein